jgi:hypothetical protein
VLINRAGQILANFRIAEIGDDFDELSEIVSARAAGPLLKRAISDAEIPFFSRVPAYLQSGSSFPAGITLSPKVIGRQFTSQAQ